MHDFLNKFVPIHMMSLYFFTILYTLLVTPAGKHWRIVGEIRVVCLKVYVYYPYDFINARLAVDGVKKTNSYFLI